MRNLLIVAFVIVAVTVVPSVLAKPGAPVTLQAGALQLQPHSQAQLQVSIRAQDAVDDLQVSVLPPDGLPDVSGGIAVGRPAAAGEVVAVPVLIQAANAGRGYINLLVTTQRRGRTEHRTVSVPVVVGDGKLRLQHMGKLQQPAGQQAVVVLPAEQTIR